MFGHIYDNEALRKYVIYFGTLFNDIYLQRKDVDDVPIQTMKVPLNYGPKEKFLARLEGNPDLDRNVAITLPRMSFEIINIQYDSQRKTNSMSKLVQRDPNDPSRAAFQWNPVPYNIEFSLYVMVKNAEDGTKIIEQILPFFTPEWSATLNVNDFTKLDIPLSLSSVSQQDTYEGDFQTRRAIIWTLNFTMRAYIFGPTRIRNIITQAEVNIRVPELSLTISDANPNNTEAASAMNVSPGQTTSNQPVNFYGSINSINRPNNLRDRNDVNPIIEYGFITDFKED